MDSQTNNQNVAGQHYNTLKNYIDNKCSTFNEELNLYFSDIAVSGDIIDIIQDPEDIVILDCGDSDELE